MKELSLLIIKVRANDWASAMWDCSWTSSHNVTRPFC